MPYNLSLTFNGQNKNIKALCKIINGSFKFTFPEGTINIYYIDDVFDYGELIEINDNKIIFTIVPYFTEGNIKIFPHSYSDKKLFTFSEMERIIQFSEIGTISINLNQTQQVLESLKEANNELSLIKSELKDLVKKYDAFATITKNPSIYELISNNQELRKILYK